MIVRVSIKPGWVREGDTYRLQVAEVRRLLLHFAALDGPGKANDEDQREA